ncbi:MAG: NAD-dependent epimerase/dehydratase family protein [Candidatus Thermoplasmatota archaeon]|nr:NAD-dependent epimerase/dehydratase family protein [Candidatus Thermoplasmatota archaeon]
MKEQGVLVTGGAGFIGSALVDLLMENKYTVLVLDDLSTGRMENLERWLDDDNFRFINGDIRHPLDGLLSPARMGSGPPISWIFHLAARVDVTSSFNDPRSDLEVNYLGTMNVLDHAVRSGVKKVVFTSSAAIYGDTSDLPIGESHPPEPLSPYGLHKLASERLIDIYHKQYNLRYTALRLFNVFGPRQDPSNQYSGVISKFMQKALGAEPLMIYGNGAQTRDFIYVGDVAEILVRAAGSSYNGPMNVATGTETSVNDLAAAVERISGKERKRVNLPERKGEIFRSVADVALLQEVLGMNETTDLREGLRETYRWMEKQR